MASIGTLLRKQWLTLVLLGASLYAVNWVVSTQRSPGAMTVVEAQAMDMTVMKPPSGVTPVAVEEAMERMVGGALSFPASVEAMDTEDVVARIPGRVSKILVYPGDRVKAGQLLATLDAAEFGAESGAASLDASSMGAASSAAELEVAQERSQRTQAAAAARMSEAGIGRAESEAAAAKGEVERAQEEIEMRRAEVAERKAELGYAQQNLDRETKLLKAGAISLDELQVAQKERDAAAARVRSTESGVRSAQQAASIAQKRLASSLQMVAEAKAGHDAALAGVKVSDASIARAKAQSRAQRLSADAARAKSAGAAATAGYRQLRALQAGIVSERLVSAGTAVGMGQAVLRLSSQAKVRVRADVPQSMAGTARVGMSATIVADGHSVSGTLTSVFPTVDPTTRTFRVEALVDNPGWLKPGLYARMSLGTSKASSTLAVRKSAVQRDAHGATFVWVVGERQGTADDSDWTCTMHPEISEKGPGICPICKMDLTPRARGGALQALRRSVRLGASDGQYTEIVDGLKVGDKVIWAGFEHLIEGTSVEPAVWGKDGPIAIPVLDQPQPVPGHEGHTEGMDMGAKK